MRGTDASLFREGFAEMERGRRVMRFYAILQAWRQPTTKKIIYSMYRVSRRHGTKQVLKDISISYYYGAKIGVIGLNGSGKSSLLRIMAGVDTEFAGDVTLSPGYTIGFLSQEPHLEAGKTVREIVSEGVQEIVDALAEFDAVNEAFGDPDADFDKLATKQAALQEKLDTLNAWDLDSRLDFAMDALRCPPPDQLVDHLSGGERRRRGPLPPSSQETRHPPSRRAHQPSRRRGP